MTKKKPSSTTKTMKSANPLPPVAMAALGFSSRGQPDFGWHQSEPFCWIFLRVVKFQRIPSYLCSGKWCFIIKAFHTNSFRFLENKYLGNYLLKVKTNTFLKKESVFSLSYLSKFSCSNFSEARNYVPGLLIKSKLKLSSYYIIIIIKKCRITTYYILKWNNLDDLRKYVWYTEVCSSNVKLSYNTSDHWPNWKKKWNFITVTLFKNCQPNFGWYHLQ